MLQPGESRHLWESAASAPLLTLPAALSTSQAERGPVSASADLLQCPGMGKLQTSLLAFYT